MAKMILLCSRKLQNPLRASLGHPWAICSSHRRTLSYSNTVWVGESVVFDFNNSVREQLVSLLPSELQNRFTMVFFSIPTWVVFRNWTVWLFTSTIYPFVEVFVTVYSGMYSTRIPSRGEFVLIIEYPDFRGPVWLAKSINLYMNKLHKQFRSSLPRSIHFLQKWENNWWGCIEIVLWTQNLKVCSVNPMKTVLKEGTCNPPVLCLHRVVNR